MREIIITNEQENQRLDKFLFKYLNDAPKSFIYKMLRKKNIKINGTKAEGSELLAAGDVLNLYLSDETIGKFSKEKGINLSAGGIDIIYEDDNILAVNKAEGILSHPDNEEKNSVIDKILLHLYNTGIYDNSSESVFTPALCNRLDRNTTGIMLCGKNLRAVQELNRIIREKDDIEKYYLALVKGCVKTGGQLSGYHLKDSSTNEVKVMKEYEEGASYIQTEFEPVTSNDRFSLLRINLITGKSHQIRAHLKFIGHPIAGDRKYGDSSVNQWAKEKYKINNQLLHAEKIIFKNSEGALSYLQGETVKAPLPEKFRIIAEDIFNDINVLSLGG